MEKQELKKRDVTRKTDEWFKEELKKRKGGEYESLTEYKGSRPKVLIRHKPCGSEHWVRPTSIIYDGVSCRECRNRLKREEKGKEIDKLLERKGGKFSRVGEVKKGAKCRIRHNACGYEWEVQVSTLKNIKICMGCEKKKSHESYKEEVERDTKGEYKVLGEYRNARTKIKMKHERCGYEWEVTPNSFLSSKSRCPKCASKGKRG